MALEGSELTGLGSVKTAGGAPPATGGGGNSALPISGDGSVGDPFTIEDDAIPLAKLDNAASAGLVGATAAGPLSLLTVAQVQTLLAAPGALVTAAADSTFLDITGIDGQTMGGIEISGCIQTPNVSGGGGLSVIYGIMPNAIAPGGNFSTRDAGGTALSNNVMIAWSSQPTLSTRLINFTLRMPVTATGRGPRMVYMRAWDSNLAMWNTIGRWNDSTTALTSIRVTGRYTDGVALAGLNAIIKDIAGHAGSSSFFTWRALGLA